MFPNVKNISFKSAGFQNIRFAGWIFYLGKSLERVTNGNVKLEV